MNIGSVGGIAGSAAGSPLAQTKGSDAERTAQETSSQQRQVQSELKADAAAGIGETDGEDHDTGERDADGRRLWEEVETENDDQNDDLPPSSSTAVDDRVSRDTTGQSGNMLDLTG